MAADANGEDETLGSWAKLLLWDYRRGSLAYDLLCLIILLAILLLPADFWSDPMRALP
jgi:hypothetical protein